MNSRCLVDKKERRIGKACGTKERARIRENESGNRMMDNI
jgi:hypothetical protein